MIYDIIAFSMYCSKITCTGAAYHLYDCHYNQPQCTTHILVRIGDEIYTKYTVCVTAIELGSIRVL